MAGLQHFVVEPVDHIFGVGGSIVKVKLFSGSFLFPQFDLLILSGKHRLLFVVKSEPCVVFNAVLLQRVFISQFFAVKHQSLLIGGYGI